MDKPQRNALGVFGILAVVITLICCVLPRIAQPAWYHHFANQRSLLGIPNFGDVVSNLPFAVFGLWGIAWMLRALGGIGPVRFIDRREVGPYLAVFCGLVLTAFGSAYYHLAPDNARLVWDRLPLIMTMMALVAAVIAERVDAGLGLSLLPVLMAIGGASVLQWYWSERVGAGDMRFYAAVQAYAVLVILFALFLPGRYTRGWDFGVVFGLYAVAKVFELCDGWIFRELHVVSGHTLKHLAAAMAGYWILRMLVKREPVAAV
ncbi:MAG: alkaline phytoceramidase [Acidobacteriota bacterium]|nr:alkaline phytoceramidase [Acidobacteriota bacterium]